MADKSSFKRLKLYSFKLNALLEITQAINENLSGEELLDRYKAILSDELSIGKIAIYKLNDGWETILTSGLTKKAYPLRLSSYVSRNSATISSFLLRASRLWFFATTGVV